MSVGLWNDITQLFNKHALAAAACSMIIGFLIGFGCNSGGAPRANIPGLKEGFLIVFPTARLQDVPATLKLRGTKVVIAHRSGEGTPPCKGHHIPLQLSANEKVSILSGNLSEIESVVEAVTQEDLQNPRLLDPRDFSIPPCQVHPKIVYGEDAKL